MMKQDNCIRDKIGASFEKSYLLKREAGYNPARTRHCNERQFQLANALNDGSTEAVQMLWEGIGALCSESGNLPVLKTLLTYVDLGKC